MTNSVTLGVPPFIAQGLTTARNVSGNGITIGGGAIIATALAVGAYVGWRVFGSLKREPTNQQAPEIEIGRECECDWEELYIDLAGVVIHVPKQPATLSSGGETKVTQTETTDASKEQESIHLRWPGHYPFMQPKAPSPLGDQNTFFDYDPRI